MSQGWVGRIFASLALLVLAGEACAQVSPQTTRLPAFDVASVRQSKPGAERYSNFPLNPGPQFGEVGGHLVGRNLPLLQYIVFAYKPNSYQIQILRSGLPDWSRGAGFDIEARVEGNPTKDEMRRMMQALLIERFHIVVHHESREMPIFALTLAKPGKMGPQLKPHPADDPSCTKTPLPQQTAGSYPAVCGVGTVVAPRTPGDIALAGQNVAMSYFVLGLTNSQNNVDRPVLDQTGLAGGYDYRLEWTPEPDHGPVAETAPDVSGPNFIEALRDQLGLKLTPQKGPVEVIVIDKLERPTEN